MALDYKEIGLMIEDSTKTSREMFVEELKKSYDKVWDVKATLESKANNIMTISGAVAALLFGFGALFLKNLHTDYQFFFLFVGLMVAGLLAGVAAMFFVVFPSGYRSTNSQSVQTFLLIGNH
jgi:hypothetical protein